MALGPNQKVTISHADPAEVTQVFAGLVRYWRYGRWLSANNRYRADCVEKITLDTAHGIGRIRHGDLATYIAASSAIHCMDGWSYVARAMEAELSGDIGAARHLAYYAELRAAMSILATAGVGVFDKKHFALKTGGQCTLLNGSTHVFVWDALEHWADQQSATDLILRVIRPGGKVLSEWLSHYSPTAGAGFRGVLAKQWLLSWGLDLQRLAEDREARNESSYRPTNISQRSHPTLNQTLDFISHFWRAHEPSGPNPFKELDRHLLRRSVAKAFQANHGSNHSPQRAPAQFSRLIGPMLHAVLPTVSDFNEQEWNDFLNYRLQPNENHLIVLAESSDPVSSPLQHLQIIARATLLLRIATGAIRENFQSLNTDDIESLAFWWKPIGVTKGIWDDGAPPDHFSDLWDDVEVSLDQLTSWRADGGNSKKGLFGRVPGAIRCLSSCERVGLWSLGI